MIVVCLPVADRRRAHAFYRDALGLEAIGAPASDGVPEPLQFALAEGVRLMLIPTGGFGWVVGDRDVAPPEQSECLLSRSAEDDAEVRVVIDKAAGRGRGARDRSRPAAVGLCGRVRRSRRARLDGHLGADRRVNSNRTFT